MAKITLKPYEPDHPIFSSGPQVFVPVSRPSTESSSKNTAGTNRQELIDSLQGAPEIKRGTMEADLLKQLEQKQLHASNRTSHPLPKGKLSEG